MKVRRLIEILQAFPSEAEIHIRDAYDDRRQFSISKIRAASLVPGGIVTVIDFAIREREEEEED